MAGLMGSMGGTQQKGNFVKIGCEKTFRNVTKYTK